MTGDHPTELTEFQVTVAQAFFAMPESRGFLLAGGAGLLAQHLTHRPTQDLDLFTSISEDVPRARDAFEQVAAVHAWTVDRIHDSNTFCRLVVTGDEPLLLDLALDSPPQLAPTITFLGPTFAAEELAARKLLALFDRAEARDFADVYQLRHAFDREALVARAAALDLGFTTALLRQNLGTLGRFTDDEIPIEAQEIASLRAYFQAWAEGPS
jgi:hypothetical protein